MASKPLGKDTENVTANVDTATFLEAMRLANVSGLSKSAYAAACIRLCTERGYFFGQSQEDMSALVDAIKSGIVPRPKVRIVLSGWNAMAPDEVARQVIDDSPPATAYRTDPLPPQSLNETPAKASGPAPGSSKATRGRKSSG